MQDVVREVPSIELPYVPPRTRPRVWLTAARARWILSAIVLVSCAATLLATRRTSATFDEIVLVAGGARGYRTGAFDLAPEHPPFMQYVYGLPVFLGGASYPRETEEPKGFGYRYAYARDFYWRSGNDPERISFLGRLPAVVCAALLILATYGFSAGRIGRLGALLAAGLVAFLPDVLAHGGVAYNDVPLALAYLLALWAFDVAARSPSWRTGVVAGAAFALALAIKFSAISLAPVGAIILGIELLVRRADKAWMRAMSVSGLAGLATCYLCLVAVYRGNFGLSEFFYGLGFTFRHVGQGHGALGYLLGQKSQTGWWYFFPVAFLFKTPAALHVLALLALGGGFRALVDGTTVFRAGRSSLLAWPLRPVAVGALVFLGALLSANLVIGFRYALPLLPLLCIMIAAGCAKLWSRARRSMRALIVVLVHLYAASSLSYYPFFLSYVSEYGPGPDRGDLVLLDSSLDWGQGLLELRDFMREESIDRVYLSYFGSADPAGYGIEYVPLASFFPLEDRPTPESRPQWVAISATNLHGLYFGKDVFAELRATQPERVLAHSLFLYRLHD